MGALVFWDIALNFQKRIPITAFTITSSVIDRWGCKQAI